MINWVMLSIAWHVGTYLSEEDTGSIFFALNTDAENFSEMFVQNKQATILCHNLED
jgi:beta-lactamase class D